MTSTQCKTFSFMSLEIFYISNGFDDTKNGYMRTEMRFLACKVVLCSRTFYLQGRTSSDLQCLLYRNVGCVHFIVI